MARPRPHTERRNDLKRAVARRLRANATETERKLWHCLRDRRLMGLRFRRQQPIGPFVVDFFCPAAKLVIEMDGGQHADRNRADYDMKRTDWLQARGYRVLRFWNSDIQDSDFIVGVISHTVREMRLPPAG